MSSFKAFIDKTYPELTRGEKKLLTNALQVWFYGEKEKVRLESKLKRIWKILKET